MNTLRRRILSLPRSYARLYTTNNNNAESPAPHTSKSTKPSTQPQTRHEAHEGTTALNVPFNPPGGGSGGSIPGGGGPFTFTNSPILDAMLTTAIGLGAGNSIFAAHLTILAQYSIP
jgi:hypothetical protein